jgi:hypothetical protein
VLDCDSDYLPAFVGHRGFDLLCNTIETVVWENPNVEMTWTLAINGSSGSDRRLFAPRRSLLSSRLS